MESIASEDTHNPRHRLTVNVLNAIKANSVANLGRSQKFAELSIAQLRLSGLSLHGREDDLKLLKSKLRELPNNCDHAAGGGSRQQLEMLLVAGISGAGKTELINRGLRDPSQKMGIAFAGGKLDQNTSVPLSALADAFSSLTRYVMAHKNAQKIKDDIKTSLGEEGMRTISSAMSGCRDLLSLGNEEGEGQRISSRRRRSSMNIGAGKAEALSLVSRFQYAIRRYLKAICSNLKGVVLFIDDLQVSLCSKLYFHFCVQISHQFL